MGVSGPSLVIESTDSMMIIIIMIALLAESLINMSSTADDYLMHMICPHHSALSLASILQMMLISNKKKIVNLFYASQ